MKKRTAGPGINNLVNTIEQMIINPNAKSGLIKHEQAHGKVYENYGGTGVYGVYYVTFTKLFPEKIHETWIAYKEMFVNVVVGAFFQPNESMEDIPALIRKEMAEAPGFSEMSEADLNIWRRANDELINQSWEEMLIHDSEENQDFSNPTAIESQQENQDPTNPTAKLSPEENEDVSTPFTQDESNPTEPDENLNQGEFVFDLSTPQIIFHR